MNRRPPAIDPLFPTTLLDIRGLVMRSYYSGTDLHPIRDLETGETARTASHGAANFIERILLPILEHSAPINILVVSDGGSDLRRAIFPGYKANRTPPPALEAQQLEELLSGINRVLVYLGATLVKVDGREADDVIGAFCKALPNQPKTVYTVDQDLMQLADENCQLVMFDKPQTHMQYSAQIAGEKEIIRVSPKFVALFKSLVGDDSDGYKGVHGFGAAKWMDLVETLQPEDFDTLNTAVKENKPQLVSELTARHPSCRALHLISNNHADWRMGYFLAQLHPNELWARVGTRFIQPVFTKRLPSRDKLLSALITLSVDDFIDRFEKWMPTQALVDQESVDDIFAFMNEHLEDSPAVGADYESYDELQNAAFLEAKRSSGKGYLDVFSQKITGASFCFGANLQHNVYLSVAHKDTPNLDKSTIVEVVTEINELKKPLIIQNANFELVVTQTNFENADRLIDRGHDTRIMASYFNENLSDEGKDGLKDLSWELLRYEQETYKGLLEKHGASDMRDLTGFQTLGYGCDDSFTACHLWVLMRWALILEDQWNFFLRNHTAPVHVISQGFLNGVNIDWDKMAELSAKDQKIIDEGMVKIRAILEEKCTEAKPEAAAAFFEADKQFTTRTLVEQWKKQSGSDHVGADRIIALQEAQKLKLVEKSVYVPYKEIKRTYEWKGTKAQLRDVSEQLGFTPVIDNDSGKGLSGWLLQFSDTVVTEQQQAFMTLLADAIGQPLKKREGIQFEALGNFVTEIMQPLMKSDWVGDELNFDSSVQMQQMLYCKLGLPVRRRSKVDRDSTRAQHGCEGSPATSKNAWNAALAEDCPPGDWRRDLLLEIRAVKDATTRFELYYTPYPLWKHPKDGHIHPSIKDPGTVTRRPTSGEPNILQVSKGETREMFIPHAQPERIGQVTEKLFKNTAPEIIIKRLPKRLILAPDFSGQELRIIGSEARDPALIHAYTGGEVYTDQYGVLRRKIQDVHSLTTVTFLHKYLVRDFGQAVLNALPLQADGRVSYDWYTKVRKLDMEKPEALQPLLASEWPDPKKLLKGLQDARSKVAKPTNFLITYLGTAMTLAENTSLPEAFCTAVMDEVFKVYHRLSPWQQETIDFARKNGYVKTAYGTRKHVSEEILSNDYSYRSRQERRACNQVIQGGAADLLHVVLTDMDERDFLGRYNAYFGAPVYDEIMLDVPLNDDLPTLITELAEMMDITPPGHVIPMMAEFSFGVNWGKQYELGERPHERQIEEALTKLFAEAA